MSVDANVARQIAYKNVAEYALTKLMEHAETAEARKRAVLLLDGVLHLEFEVPTRQRPVPKGER